MMAGAVIGFLAYQVTLNKTRKPAVASISKFDEVLYYLNAASSTASTPTRSSRPPS